MENQFAKQNENSQQDTQDMSGLVPGRSKQPPAFALKAGAAKPTDHPGRGLIQASIGENGVNAPDDIGKLVAWLGKNGVPGILLDQLRRSASLGGWVHKYQREVLGWSGTDGRIDPKGKTINAILQLRGRDVVKGWVRDLVRKKKAKDTHTAAKKEKTKVSDKPKDLLGEDGWSIAPILSKEQHFSQAHPSLARGVNSIPRKIAFSGALKKYDRGGSADIYDDAKVKSKWKKLSQVGREQKVYWRACKNTATYMAGQAGYADTGSAGSVQTLTEEGKTRKATADFSKGVSKLDRYLLAGIPVVAGVDKGKKGLNASATDHFIVIVGRGEDEKGKYYCYFDPGRTHAAGADTSKNRLYVNRDVEGNAKGDTIAGNNGAYKFTLSEVRTMKES